MSTQSVPRQFPVPLNLPGHAPARRGPVPVDRAHELAVPKVGLSEICLSYRTQSGERLLALEGINLDVRAGEFLCIVGPSGCGKSTLLHLIAGLQAPTSGQIEVDGNPIQGPATAS
jgi:ABC-type bacteriocin/lantibiotic exporter with double-glycine peptidase domain